jgi:hypothetical protein
MKVAKLFVILLAVFVIGLTIASCQGQPASAPEESSDFQTADLTDEGGDRLHRMSCNRNTRYRRGLGRQPTC